MVKSRCCFAEDGKVPRIITDVHSLVTFSGPSRVLRKVPVVLQRTAKKCLSSLVKPVELTRFITSTLAA